MILHSPQFLNKNILSSGKIAKIRGSWGGDAMTLWNGNSREEGGLRQKCSPWGYGDFLKLHNFNSIRGSQNLGEGLFANSLFRVVSKTIRERTRPPITLLPRAARVCLSRYLPQRVCSQAMIGCTSKYVLQTGAF